MVGSFDRLPFEIEIYFLSFCDKNSAISVVQTSKRRYHSSWVIESQYIIAKSNHAMALLQAERLRNGRGVSTKIFFQVGKIFNDLLAFQVRERADSKGKSNMSLRRSMTKDISKFGMHKISAIFHAFR